MAIIGALAERLFSLTPGQNHSRVVVTPDFSPTVGHVKQIRETSDRKNRGAGAPAPAKVKQAKRRLHLAPFRETYANLSNLLKSKQG